MSGPHLPERLLELALGYQRAKTLFAVIELGVPALLATGPQPRDAIARSLGIHPLAADRFLHAAVALGLLERDGNRFGNAPVTARYLVPGQPTDVSAALRRMNDASYPVWSELARRLREWSPGGVDGAWPAEPADQGPDALEAQHNLSRLTGEALADAWDFAPYRHLLDVGGGTGAMSIALCRRFPRLTATVLDRPAALERATARITEAALADRVTTLAGDFRTDALPEGFDVALLANLLSVASEAENRALFQRLFERLPAGGTVILSGWMLDADRDGPLAAVLFCLEDINWRAPDVERTATTYADWLRAAGFAHVRQSLYAPPTRLIAAQKP